MVSPSWMWMVRGVAVLCFCVALAGPLMAQTMYVLNETTGAIDTYDGVTGALVQAGFISAGLEEPAGVAVDGWTNTVYVADWGSMTLTAYDGVTGLAKGGFLPPSVFALTVTVSGTGAYVGYDDGVSVYNAATGAEIRAGLVDGTPGDVQSLAVADGHLYMLADGGVSKFNAVTGEVESFIFVAGSNFTAATSIAVGEGRLYVVDNGQGVVSTWNGETGASLNPEFISLATSRAVTYAEGKVYVAGMDGVLARFDAVTGGVEQVSVGDGSFTGIAVAPEPGTFALLVCGAGALWVWSRRCGACAKETGK